MKLFDLVESQVNNETENIKVGDQGIIFGTDGYGAVYVEFHHAYNLVLFSPRDLKVIESINARSINFRYEQNSVFIPVKEIKV